MAAYLKLRVVGGQHRKAIARRRGVDDVAAERAAVLNLHRANRARRRDQRGRVALRQRRANQLGVGHERADAQVIAFIANAAQLGDAPDVEKAGGVELMRVHQDHQVSAAGDNAHAATVLGQ